MRARRHPAPPPSRTALRRPLLQASFVGAVLTAVVVIGLFPVRITSATATPALQASRLSLPGLASVGPISAGDALVARAIPLTLVAPAVNPDAVVRANDGTIAAIQSANVTLGDTVRAASEQQDKIPIFFEYRVQPGDTISGIASRFGIRTNYVIWNNADITDSNALKPGQTLQVPSAEGIVHSVRLGDTVTEIAQRYDAKATDIIQFRANGLSGDPNKLREGSQILVPGGRKVDIAPTIAPRPNSAAGPSGTRPASIWGWPVQGLLTSPFGPSHPLGIDVAVAPGTPVQSAAAGTVTFVGGNPCCSYGYHIIIDNGAGYETVYAHLSSFLVAKGDKVAAGQRVALSGSSGLSTGPHLHFELHRNGAIQNPLQYLP